MSKTAVVLFNLGGPDSLRAVRPFLYNLFSDPAIIRLPGGLRQALAFFISWRRARVARRIYAQLGGASPILQHTHMQAEALQAALGAEYKVFICMRYWHPQAPQVALEVRAYAPDQVILLPLYPQFSTTTTASSFAAWEREKINIPTRYVESYPVQADFIAAHVELLRAAYKPGMRVLFSAHGLPEVIVASGDPYPAQVEQTVRAIAAHFPDMDYVICYQSRVGPLKWIGPSTEEEIRRAGRDGVGVIIVPVSFVSEHSETLYELDVEYAALARGAGVREYVRVPALGTQPKFIAALAALCRGNT